MKKTWIGHHRLISIGPIVKPLAHLILPQRDVTSITSWESRRNLGTHTLGAEVKKTWIGHHRPISIGPIVKPLAHLILPQCDVTRRQTNKGFHIYRGCCSRTCAERTSWVFFVMPRLLSEICWLCIRWLTFVLGGRNELRDICIDD